MFTLDAGARVTQVRFLPDNRLLVGTWAAGDADLGVWTLPGGPRVAIPLSVRQVWDAANQLAVAPAGDRIHLGLGGLRTFATADGALIPSDEPPANQVIASADGARLVVAYTTNTGDTELCGRTAGGERLWGATFPGQPRHHLAGFLPDGEQFVAVGHGRVRVCVPPGPGAGDRERVARYPSTHVNHPQVSPDGRHLGVIGYGKLYLYDTATLDAPRALGGTRAFGDFVGFAFHPGGRTLAVIHGGPTLVKLYDLDTLTLRAKLNWKAGPLTCVAFSPDGLLAAAGADDGRVVVWDVDE